MSRSLGIEMHAGSCPLRTCVRGDGREELIRIAGRCDPHRAHCFVSSGDHGKHMHADRIAQRAQAQLQRARARAVTLTGGGSCAQSEIVRICGKDCSKAIVSRGGQVGDLHREQCAVPAESVLQQSGRPRT